MLVCKRLCTCLCCKWEEEKPVHKNRPSHSHKELQERYLHLNKGSQETVQSWALPATGFHQLSKRLNCSLGSFVICSVGFPGVRGMGLPEVGKRLEYWLQYA